MQVLSIILQSACTAVGFAVLCGLVGHVFPRSWLLSGSSAQLQRILLGFASLVIILRFPYREQLPIVIGPIVVAALALCGAVMVIRRWVGGAVKANRRQGAAKDMVREWAIWALAILPSLALFYGPLVARDALFLPTVGPDLYGNLISAGYIAAGHELGDLLQSMHQVTGNYKWWNLGHQHWTLPDFRQAVAIEFFLRSIRWGHAVITSLISRVTGEPVWIAFYALMAFSAALFPSTIIDAARSRGISPMRTALVAIIVTATQTYVLMLNEGIDVQFIAMPVVAFLLFNFHRLMTEVGSIGQKISVAILLSALITTFGEGVQVIIIYAAILTMLIAVRYRFRLLVLVRMSVAILAIGGFCIAVGPVAVVDFVLWSLIRLRDNFNGGALALHWSPMSIIFSIPYVTLVPESSPHLVVADGWTGRAVEAVVLIGLGIAVARRRIDEGIEILAAAGAVFLFVVLNMLYPLWKATTMLQPLFVVCVVAVLPECLGILRKGALLAVYTAFALFGGGRLLTQYVHHGLPVRPNQFVINESAAKGENLVLLTPSVSVVYLGLGASHPLYLVRGWELFGLVHNFRIDNIDNLHIGIYYDCDAEGKLRCAEIRQATGLPPRMVRPLSLRLSVLEDRLGHVSDAQVDSFIKATFGVPAK